VPTRVAFTSIADEGTPEWELQMGGLGQRMRSAGVRLVVFAHGSFVGDDPFALARAFDDALPGLPDIGRALRSFTRDQIARTLGDLSNFSGAYVAAFARATGLEAKSFTWSGGSHHAARVQGAVQLARSLTLHGGYVPKTGDRLLLIGHSHGGQLFAILSQLVARAHGCEELVGAAAALGEDVEALEGHLALLRRWAIDVATFGMPTRYGWARGAGFRLMHVVGHRGGRTDRRSLRGALQTSQGDYIHHLGTHGSDMLAADPAQRRINERLDAVLGVGRSWRMWLQHVGRGLRVSPEGHTVLVDYRDASRFLPNFWETGFGHAAYTRQHAMLFHTQLVANHFYPVGGSPLLPRARGWTTPLLPRRRSRTTGHA
jgi:hypothetical protein